MQEYNFTNWFAKLITVVPRGSAIIYQFEDSSLQYILNLDIDKQILNGYDTTNTEVFTWPYSFYLSNASKKVQQCCFLQRAIYTIRNQFVLHIYYKLLFETMYKHCVFIDCTILHLKFIQRIDKKDRVFFQDESYA